MKTVILYKSTWWWLCTECDYINYVVSTDVAKVECERCGEEQDCKED